ncbi:phage tail terminator protein [Carnimonas bestiolae]|uniref:phage tail terminator protein n=1 Tax=Carnimonas bestiolae TaxID=3402172 RepID=UPI003EDC0BFD
MLPLDSGDSAIGILIDRLRELVPQLKTVDEAWFAQPIDDLGDEVPAGLPYLAGEGANSDIATLRPIQQMEQTYGLWIVAPRDIFGEVRKQIRLALFGHQLSQYHNPLQYGQGGQMDVKGRYVWWHETWTTTTHYRV